jgi:hypothetical protein
MLDVGQRVQFDGHQAKGSELIRDYLVGVLWDFRVPKSRNVINKLEWPDEQTIFLNKELDCIPRLSLTT